MGDLQCGPPFCLSCHFHGERVDIMEHQWAVSGGITGRLGGLRAPCPAADSAIAVRALRDRRNRRPPGPVPPKMQVSDVSD